MTFIPEVLKVIPIHSYERAPCTQCSHFLCQRSRAHGHRKLCLKTVCYFDPTSEVWLRGYLVSKMDILSIHCTKFYFSF